MSKREILAGNSAKEVKKLAGQLVKEDLQLIEDRTVLLAVVAMVKLLIIITIGTSSSRLCLRQAT